MTSFTSESFFLRAMQADDLAAVAEMERRCHATPWSDRLFREELICDHAAIDLLWHADRRVGYVCCRQICDELHILKVTVEHAFRRRGLGRMLLDHVLQRACAAGCRRVFLEVRTGNTGAIALYSSFGFETVGRRKGYYPDGEDALVMERSLTNG
jgi:ribosomal-protein-alanine N-acetyltransferase